MDRWILRVSSLIFTIVLCLCAIQATQGFQRLHPCESNVSFSLNIVNALYTKEELAKQLADIGNEHNALIGKVASNPERYTEERDIVIFSGNPNSKYGPIILDNQVLWLDQSVTGSVISYIDLDSHPLNGEYFATGSEELFSSLTTWCRNNSIEINYHESKLNPSKEVLHNFFLSDMGLLAFACFFMIVAAAFTILHNIREKQRIESISGKPRYQIRIDSCLDILKRIIQGCVLGIVVVCSFILTFPEGVKQLYAILSLCATPLIFCILIMFITIGILSFFSLPSFNKLGLRHISGTILDVSEKALECLGISLTVVALVSSYTMIDVQTNLLKGAEAYSDIPEATRLSLLYAPNEAIYSSATEIRKLIKLGESSDDLLLSLDVNQSILIDDEMLDGFDRFVIVNSAYLDAIKINIGSPGQNGEIFPLSTNEIPTFAKLQSEIWLSENNLSETVFCHYEGSGLLALGANTGKGGEAIIANNPLVMVVENLDTSWNYSGFIIPLLSSGNLFFKNYTTARSLVKNSGASSIVAAFDNIADLSLQQAQVASQKIAILALSIFIAFILTLAMSVQSAVSWCTLNAQLIFAKRSSGSSLISIGVEGLSRRIAIIGLGSLLGAMIAILLNASDDCLVPFLTMLGVFALITLCSIIFRCRFIHIIFQRTAMRR